MRVIKKINNNVAVCLDNDGNELIAFGKGIGFPATPYEFTDLKRIWRTYYDIKPSYLNLLNEIPEEIVTASIKIVDYAKTIIRNEINSNIVLTLADHINFSIERYKKNLDVKMPFIYDIRHLYPNEMKVGEWAVKLINKEMNIYLAKDESVSIALHFINAESMGAEESDGINEKKIITDLTSIVENDFSIQIAKESFNYSRFVTHLEYLLKRSDEKSQISSENLKMFESMKEEYPKTLECVLHIRKYLKETMNWELGEEELLYLMLHINRVCAHEDCNL